jgi:hypothetical protein
MMHQKASEHIQRLVYEQVHQQVCLHAHDQVLHASRPVYWQVSGEVNGIVHEQVYEQVHILVIVSS